MQWDCLYTFNCVYICWQISISASCLQILPNANCWLLLLPRSHRAGIPVLHNHVECTGTEHYIIIWNIQGRNITWSCGMYRDGTLHNHMECTGMELYIFVWNVQGRNITQWCGMYRDGTLHTLTECTGTEHYIIRWLIQGQKITHLKFNLSSSQELSQCLLRISWL